MAKTRTRAIKEKRQLDKRIDPNLQTIIIDYTKDFPIKSRFRYNHRFIPKVIKLKKKDKIYTERQAQRILDNYSKKERIKFMKNLGFKKK